MAINHRCVLRVSTDLALAIFFFFFIGAVLWVTDEFLGWDVLPAWVETYAQLIIIVVGAAAGLAIASSLLCSVVVIAEAAAERVGIHDYKLSGRAWKILGAAAVLFALSLFIFSKVDAHRKALFAHQHRERVETNYLAQVRDLQSAIPSITNLFPAGLASKLTPDVAVEPSSGLVTFLSAVRSSTPHRPEVSLLIRAEAPYEFCRFKLAMRRDAHSGDMDRFYLEKQFYFGFPTPAETTLVRQLFTGQIEPLGTRLEGEFINNARPSAWGLLRSGADVVGVLLIETRDSPGYDLFHFGPGRPL